MILLSQVKLIEQGFPESIFFFLLPLFKNLEKICLCLRFWHISWYFWHITNKFHFQTRGLILGPPGIKPVTSGSLTDARQVSPCCASGRGLFLSRLVFTVEFENAPPWRVRWKPLRQGAVCSLSPTQRTGHWKCFSKSKRFHKCKFRY